MTMIVAVSSVGNEHLRAQVTANVAALLASDGHKVVVMSVGASPYFMSSLIADVDSQMSFYEMPGIYDLILDYYGTLSGQLFDQQRLLPTDVQPARYGTLELRRPSTVLLNHPVSGALRGGGELKILRGGPAAIDSNFSVNWTDFKRKWAGHAYFAFVREDLLRKSDFVIVECAAELMTPLYEIMTRTFADVVVLLAGYSSGVVEWAKTVIEWIIVPPRTYGTFERVPTVVPVPAGVHRASEERLIGEFRLKFAEKFGHYLTHLPRNSAPIEFFMDVEIPFIPYYDMTEEILAFQPLEQRTNELFASYRALTTAIKAFDAPILPGNATFEAMATAFANAGLRGEWDVFLSYASEDIELARLLRSEFVRRGIRAFMAEEDIAGQIGTDRWIRTIERVIGRSKLMVVLVSQAGLKSKWVEFEWRQFLARIDQKDTRLLIPACIGYIRPDSLQDELAAFHAVSVRKSTAGTYNNVEEIVGLATNALGI
jgi:hypothetical protein